MLHVCLNRNKLQLLLEKCNFAPVSATFVPLRTSPQVRARREAWLEGLMWWFEREVVRRTEKQLNIRAYMRALVYSASMNTSELQVSCKLS